MVVILSGREIPSRQTQAFREYTAIGIPTAGGAIVQPPEVSAKEPGCIVVFGSCRRNHPHTRRCSLQGERRDCSCCGWADRGLDERRRACGTQRFAEGFDPDRVASAFASDLAGLAENNLQSTVLHQGFTGYGG